MIRYPISNAELVALVDAENGTWRTRAQTRTQALTTAGRYVKASEFWSEIKIVFMRLQHFKCVFCERPLAGEQVGAVEQDVEHFRPKGRVTAWPKKKGPKYTFSTGAADPKGYYWLAYDLQNYAASCKPCNSTLKSDGFPIAAAARGPPLSSVGSLHASETPFLIYPIGDIDDDPEELITFNGIVVQAKATDEAGKRRAQVTIDFFKLNEREELWHQRAHIIRSMFDAFDISRTALDHDRRQDALDTLDNMTDPQSPHTSCARRYRELLETNPAGGWELYKVAKTYLKRPIRPPSA